MQQLVRQCCDALCLRHNMTSQSGGTGSVSCTAAKKSMSKQKNQGRSYLPVRVLVFGDFFLLSASSADLFFSLVFLFLLFPFLLLPGRGARSLFRGFVGPQVLISISSLLCVIIGFLVSIIYYKNFSFFF